MREKHFISIGALALIFALALPLCAQENRQGRFHLGLEVGPQFSTADSTAFTFAFSGDYFLTQNVSIGPLLQVGVTDDLFQFGPTAQLKYTFDLDSRLKASLQGGIGAIYAELERRGRDRDDTCILIPVGPGIEYQLTDGVSIGSTLLLNFMDLEDVRGENFSASLLGGVKIRF